MIGRYTGGSSPTYYRIGVVQGPGEHRLLRAQRNDGSSLTSDLTRASPPPTGLLWLRVEFQGANPTAIRARVWPAGGTEPGTWALNIRDSTAADQVPAGSASAHATRIPPTPHVRLPELPGNRAHGGKGGGRKEEGRGEGRERGGERGERSGGQEGAVRIRTIGGGATGHIEMGRREDSPPPPPAPTISGFSPASGPAGSTVTISGSGFTGATAVAFNGTSAASYTVKSDTQITATVPAGATTGPVSVTAPGGTATSTASFTVTATPPAPAISGFSPASGPAGSTVTISGSGFTGATAVAFNGTSAASLHGQVRHHDHRHRARRGHHRPDLGHRPGRHRHQHHQLHRHHRHAQIATDSFSRTVTGGWGSADLGGPWTVLDTAANWSVAPGHGQHHRLRPGRSSAACWPASRCRTSTCWPSSCCPAARAPVPTATRTSMGRYTGGATQPITGWAWSRVPATHRHPDQRAAQRRQQPSSSDVDTGIAAAAGAIVWLRVEFQGVNPTAIRARAWAAGETRARSPGSLNITDSTAADQVAGAVGVRARNEDSSPDARLRASRLPRYRLRRRQRHTIAADSFQRSTASGWGTPTRGGWWTVVGSPGTGRSRRAPAAWRWARTAPSERATCRASPSRTSTSSSRSTLPRCSVGNCDAFVLGRYTPGYTPTYYQVGVVQGTGGDILLRAQRSDGTALAATSTPACLPPTARG